MAVIPGTRLGVYAFTAQIGAGGMGQVFRARDTKLHRDVAIEVLPAALADDPERLTRPTREAQALASLNHPRRPVTTGTHEIMKVRSSLLLLLISATLGAALTGFYFVHESLPRAIRAPTSLILAPVAVVDGLCYAIGASGIYGRPVPVLLVNWAFGLIVCCSVLGVKRWFGRRKAAASDALAAQQQRAADGAARRR